MPSTSDPTFASAVDNGLPAGAVAFPEPADEHGQPASDARAELIQRCKAAIEDGLYETDARLDAAVQRLAQQIG